ncbi:MAG: hypothetical protein ABI723_21230 [Bacteroidia bacterium]
MKKNSTYIFLLLFVIACGTKKSTEQDNAATPVDSIVSTAAIVPDSFKQGEILPNILCKNDPSKSFALYLPNTQAPNTPRPIIFFFDAHGDPTLPLTKYKKLADEFNFILIGSYNSKNGNDWNTTSQIWSTLFVDASQRIKFDQKRIYTAGFSGGAKVASYIALNNSNIAGVIANSAGFPETQQQAPSGNFNFIGMAGTGDMNMTELVTLNQQLDQSTIKHQLLMFAGKHEWCPLETMHDAFTWFEFNAVKDSTAVFNKKIRDDFMALHDKKIDRLKKENNLLALADENKLMVNYLNQGISDLAGKYAEAMIEIKKSPVYQKQLADYNSLLEREKNVKSNLASALQQNPDEAFWKSTINDLNKQANAKNADGAMYKRVISYLSLASYSFSNRALNTGDNETAAKYISLYKIIDPTNSEAYYFAAMLNARAKNFDAAKAELQKAVANGFNDWERMKAQQEFAGMNLDGIEK